MTNSGFIYWSFVPHGLPWYVTYGFKNLFPSNETDSDTSSLSQNQRWPMKCQQLLLINSMLNTHKQWYIFKKKKKSKEAESWLFFVETNTPSRQKSLLARRCASRQKSLLARRCASRQKSLLARRCASRQKSLSAKRPAKQLLCYSPQGTRSASAHLPNAGQPTWNRYVRQNSASASVNIAQMLAWSWLHSVELQPD